jgi:hypothetical protein
VRWEIRTTRPGCGIPRVTPVQAVESYEQAVRERRAHEWWGRRPTWRKEPSILMLERALASGDPMRVVEALEHVARLTGELTG